jgi:hypothetical protein
MKKYKVNMLKKFTHQASACSSLEEAIGHLSLGDWWGASGVAPREKTQEVVEEGNGGGHQRQHLVVMLNGRSSHVLINIVQPMTSPLRSNDTSRSRRRMVLSPLWL